MSPRPVAILGAGLVTSVGLTAAACGCAFRTKLTNPCETRFIDSSGAWIMAHQVDLAPPRSGLGKLAGMAALAISEALCELDRGQWRRVPMLLCVAEPERPGRLAGLDEQLPVQIQQELGTAFAPGSALLPLGRVGVAVALAKAREMLRADEIPGVLIVGVDSLLSWETLGPCERDDRLLTESNANGFMPGEGAGALWVGRAERPAPRLWCSGIGLGREPAPINSGEPLRAEGLTQAIKACLADAGRQMHELDFRITDLSGEQYYFKEASLALTRTLRTGKETFDLWHPAECTGETGAASGVAVIVAAQEACRKGYAPGPRVLAHWSGDGGQRAAVVLEFRGGA